jgi:hypothetical protein
MRPDEDGKVEAFIRDRVTDDEIVAGLAGMEEAKRLMAMEPTGAQG